jgi:hypothetical protein
MLGGRRRNTTLWKVVALATVTTLLLVIFGVAAWSRTDSYSVEPGPPGNAVTLTMPPQIGQLTYLMPDPDPYWQRFPNLRPDGTTSTFTTATGLYATSDPSGPNVRIDAVFATENSDGTHRGIFSLSPQKLVDLVQQRIGPANFEHFASMHPNTVLECGDYGMLPLCVWADDSALLILDSLGKPDNPADVAKLAAMTPAYRDALASS